MKRRSKKRIALLLASAMLATTGMGLGGMDGSVVYARENANAANALYVAMDGSDETGDGTFEKPFATFEKARDAARELKQENMTVFVREGTYFFQNTLELTPQDSGITFRNYNGEAVELSGALTFDQLSWSDYEGNPHIKVAKVDKNLGIDKLFLDKEEQVLARYPDATPGVLPLEGATTRADIKSRVKNYADPTGGYIRAIHSNGWGGNDYIITGKNTSNALGLDYQWVGDNNRGNGMKDNAVMIENVFEELDASKEWYYDNKEGNLYVYPEEGVDLNDVSVEAAVNTDIIKIEGEDSTHPASDITLDGFTYFGTKRTMFTVNEEGKEYIPLMRGDWCVVRAGAVYIENARNIQVVNSNFNHMGGNGIFMYGYNDSHIVDNNEFIDIGSTAVQVVGDPKSAYEASFWDHALYPNQQVHKTSVDFPEKVGPATEDYPRDIEITNNHMENLGIFEKQSCGVNLSVSSRIKILHNTIHKSARSCINVNDGTFGGHEIAYNDVYNAQLETTDHGPFNSWGRDRFWSVPKYNASGESGDLIRNYTKDGKVYDLALIDAYQTNKIHDNRFQHDSDAPHTWGIDLDDGSSNYEIYNNLCLGLGIKLREGFDRKVYNNIILDGQFQIHVSYKEAGDEIYSNIVANTTPYGFAAVDENRFKQAEYAVDKNWYYDFGAKINLPSWYYVNKSQNDYDKNALIDVDPKFKNARSNDYTVLNEEGMEKVGFKNFAMDQFGKPGCQCKAPIYAKIDSGSGGSDILQREEWKGATVTGIDDNIISSTASNDYNGIYFEEVPENSEAYALGYRKRDIVKSVNGAVLSDKKSFFAELKKIEANALVILDIHRTNSMQTLSYHKAEGVSGYIDCNDPEVTYSSQVSTDLYTQDAWYFDSRKSADQGSTVCAFPDIKQANSAWFEVAFTGTKIEYISRKYSDQGDIEMILTNADTGEEVERKTISCKDNSRLYQQTVYTSPILPEGNYKLRGEKKSGVYMIVDAFQVYRQEEDKLNVLTDPAQIKYENSTVVSEPRAGETFRTVMDFKNKSATDIEGKVSYLLYDIEKGWKLLDIQEDPVTIKGSAAYQYTGNYTFPEDISNKVLQIMVTNSADEAIAYNTWIKAEGTEMKEAPVNPDTKENTLGISYDKNTRTVKVTAAGVTSNSQAVIRVTLQGKELFANQVKAQGKRAGFEFVLPDSMKEADTVDFFVHSELGKAIAYSLDLNPSENVVNKDTLNQAIDTAKAITNDNYTKDSWYLFQKALKTAKDALESKELTQEKADQLALSLKEAQEALEKAEYTVITKGNNDAVKRTGEWTVRANSESCDTTAKGSYAEFEFTGNAIEWYSVTASDHGIADVSIVDQAGAVVEGSQKKVDCYTANRGTNVLLYQFKGLDSNENYKIIVKQDGKNASAGSTYIEIYSFRVQKTDSAIVDKTELQTLYDTVASYKESEYTEESFGKLTAAAELALKVLEGNEAGNAEVSDTCALLRDAIDHLVRIVKAEGIEISQAIALLEPGDTLELAAYVKPENATNKNITWVSSNEQAASVDQNGLVSAEADGVTEIKAITQDGGFEAVCTVTVKETVKVTSVSLDCNAARFTNMDDTLALTAAIMPENSENRKVVWSSSDPKIADVDENGVVTPVANGVAVITVTTEDGGFTDKCKITVDIPREPVKVTGILLDIKSAILTEKGETLTLNAKVEPENAFNQEVMWKSFNEAAAIVNEAGRVTAVASGKAVIAVTTRDGGYVALCEITVEIPEPVIPVTGISLQPDNAILTGLGDKLSLNPEVKPENATDKAVTYRSSNPDAATVDEKGVVTAAGEGETVITAATVDGGFEAVCKVKVEIPVENVDVTGVTLNQTEAVLTKENETLRLVAQILPENATNKKVEWYSSNQEAAAVDDNGVITAIANGESVITVTTEDGAFTAQCRVKVEIPVRVEGIYLSHNLVQLDKEGATLQLQATVNPDNAENKNVAFTSTAPQVAQVSQEGLITARSNGQTAVIATTEDGKFTAVCIVTVDVKAPHVAVTGVKLDKTEVNLTAKGDTVCLKAVVEPEAATNKGVLWISSNTGIAVVNQSGVVTAVGNGTVTVTAVTTEGEKAASCKVNVRIPVPVQKPAKVTGLKASSAVYSMKLTWNKAADAKSYRIYIYRDGKWRTAGSTTRNSFTIKKLNAGSRYSVKVAAVNQAGTGPDSSVLKTASKPQKAVISSIVKAGSSKVKITYKKVTCSGYQILMKSGKGSYKQIKTTGKTSYTINKLKKGTKYSFKVRAYRKVGSKIYFGKYSNSKTYTLK